MEKNCFVNNFYIYIANASNAIWYDQALIALYYGQILASYDQPNLWNSKLNFVGVKPPPPLDSNRVKAIWKIISQKVMNFT